MKTAFFKLFFSIVALQFLISISANANNVQVTNVVRNGQNITFDLSWENSWNVQGQPSNHDAVWVFIKYKKCSETIWNHALLNTNMSAHSFGSDITYATPISEHNRFGTGTGNNTGVMIKRSDIGIGNISPNSVTLNVVGPVAFDTDDYDIRVFAIEMVYIPEGEFFAGNNAYRRLKEPNGGQDYIHITSEDTITVDDDGYISTLNVDFPKGYGSFYIMKYEITQGQYVDFLNTLTAGDLEAWDGHTDYMHEHMHNTGTDGIVYTTTSPNRALNYLSQMDLFAYLDWAALRPMTELEFEKACRGSGAWNYEEFAWGNDQVTQVENVSGTTAGVEVATDTPAPNANYYWTTIHGGQFGSGELGPVAAGFFARTANTRVGAGASFYGVMELSGNVTEVCIAVADGNADDSPSTYTGLWGDGYLDAYADYNESDWQNHYYFRRGGGWDDGYWTWDRARVSYRGSMPSTDDSGRGKGDGGRGVR